MLTWAQPPVEKVYQALTVIADRRIQELSRNRAIVSSSDGSRQYLVQWNDERSAFGSTDRASTSYGYIGYPIIAALLMLRQLPWSEEAAAAFAGIPWKRLYQQHSRDPRAIVDAALEQAIAQTGATRLRLVQEAEDLHRQLGCLSLGKIRDEFMELPPQILS